MNSLIELAEACEKATGPDRALDERINAAMHPDCNARVIYAKGKRFYMSAGEGRIPFAVGYGVGTKFGVMFQSHRYTSSLDAAMTLKPKAFHLHHLGEARYMTRSPAFSAQLEVWTTVDGVDCSMPRFLGVASTEPLALCAASLRARASLNRGVGG